jgi:hypothetical protein
MDRAQVHFELFVRRHRRTPWALELATEDRRTAFEAADDIVAEARDAAVRLCKETRDPATGDFRPLVLLERGVKPAARRWRGVKPEPSPTRPSTPSSCTQPQDLYATPAREAIGRLLAAWLKRRRATPFELLHRADLAEQLEACEAELSAALYNAALDGAAGRGAPLEPIRRTLETLARRTIERIVGGDADPAFQFGVAVAARLARRAGWSDKVATLLDLLDAPPASDQPAGVVLRTLQQPLIDIFGVHGGLDDILGEGLASGDQLLLLLQIASAPEVAASLAGDAALGRIIPRLRGLAARLALTLHSRPGLARTRGAIGRRVLVGLASETPLWPNDPTREIEGMKAFAALLALSGRLVDQEEAAEALARRWRRMASPAFLDGRLLLCKGALEDADVILDLVDVAVGRAPIRALGERLLALTADRAFEQEARFSPDPLPVILGRLASLAARIRDSALQPETRVEAERRMRRLWAAIEADAIAFSA